MIALLLAAQFSTALVHGMPAERVLPPTRSAERLLPPRTGVFKIFPGPGDCPGAGRMEASLSRPSALYRAGDRPAVMLRKWVDYPDPRGCLVGPAK